MAEITGVVPPSKNTIGSIGDIYINTITGQKYELLSIYNTSDTNTDDIPNEITKEYDWQPVIKNGSPEQLAQIEQNKNDIADLNSDLAVERSRINNITSLKEGSTTGDAELADGRTDYTGKTWPNIGEHIRGVSSQLSGDIVEVKNDLNYITETKTVIEDLGHCATTSNTAYNNVTFLDGYYGWGTGIHVDNPVSKIKINIKASQNSIVKCQLCQPDYTEIASVSKSIGTEPAILEFEFDNKKCVGDILVLFSVPSTVNLGYARGFTLTNKYCLTREDGKILWYHLNNNGWGVWYELSQGTLFSVETTESIIVPKTDKTFTSDTIPPSSKSVKDRINKINEKFSELGSMNYIYVSKNGSDVNGDGSKENPFATIYHANESITDNSKNKKYTIIVGQGTYTDLQDKYSGVIYQSGSGYQGVVCKDYVYYESENIARPDLCVIKWDGSTGLASADITNDNTSPKCPFHIVSDTHTHIKGFKIECSNTRYTMHIETAGGTNPSEWEISNCVLIWNGANALTDGTNTFRPVIGIGTTLGEKGYINECEIVNNDCRLVIQTHDNANNPNMYLKVGTRYLIENCKVSIIEQLPSGSVQLWSQWEFRGGSAQYDVDNIVEIKNVNTNKPIKLDGNQKNWKSNILCCDVYKG